MKASRTCNQKPFSLKRVVFYLCIYYGGFVFFNAYVEATQFLVFENSSECGKVNDGRWGRVFPLFTENGVQYVSSVIKFLPSVPVAGKVMTEPISKQSSQYCEASGDQGKLVWSDKHTEFLLFGWGGGLIVYAFFFAGSSIIVSIRRFNGSAEQRRLGRCFCLVRRYSL